MFDWVGFDAYGSSVTQLGIYLSTLERELAIPTSGKRTFIIPDAYSPAPPVDPASAADPTVNALSAQQPIYEQLLEAHASVIAVIAFLYNSQPGLTGLDKMPTVQALYRQWFGRLQSGLK